MIQNTELKLEVFAADRKAEPVRLHCYRLLKKALRFEASVAEECPAEEGDFFRAVGKLRNMTHAGIFFNGKHIYSTQLLDVERLCGQADFGLKYLAEECPPVEGNLSMYEEILRYYILKKLEQVKIGGLHKKYAMKWDITSRCPVTKEIFSMCSILSERTGVPQLHLLQKYDFRIEIKKDRSVFIWPDTGMRLESDATIADFLRAGKKVEGMAVVNDWAAFPEYGVITEVAGETIDAMLSFGKSLRDYYREVKGEAFRVDPLPKDTPVVRIRLRSGAIIDCCPQALRPYVEPSPEMLELFRRNMVNRILLDRSLLRDIGSLEEMGGLTFIERPCSLRRLGYKAAFVAPPKLIAKAGAELPVNSAGEPEKRQIFDLGFYDTCSKRLTIGYIYPKKDIDALKVSANAIYRFVSKKENPLLPIVCRPGAVAAYADGSKEEISSAVGTVCRGGRVNFIISIVPEQDGEEYTFLKEALRQAKLPSQMLTLSTARFLFGYAGGEYAGSERSSACNDSECNRNKQSGNYKFRTNYSTRVNYRRNSVKRQEEILGNITLEILSKTGGTPWILKDGFENIGLILYKKTEEKNDDTAGNECVVVMDRQGRMIGTGNCTEVEELIGLYRRKHGSFAKQILVVNEKEHEYRREEAVWSHFIEHLEKDGTLFTEVEVYRCGGVRMLQEEDGIIKNPLMGHVIYRDNQAFLVQSGIDEKSGAPRPIRIRRCRGDLSIPEIVTCIYDVGYLRA